MYTGRHRASRRRSARYDGLGAPDQQRGVRGSEIARELDISPSVVYNSTRRYELFENPTTGAHWFRRTNYI